MTPEELQSTFNAPAGYLGPIGIEAAPHPKKPGTLVILDKALEGRTNLIAGANKEEYHLRNVTPTRDFKPTLIADVRNILEGEGCPIDGSPLRLGKAVEIGHIFKLGYKYSKSMGASVLNREGKEVTPIMGSYGIGIERILSAAVELYHDADGIVLPAAIAPFTVVVTPVNIKDDAQCQAAAEIYAAFKSAGLDALFDDRDERPGVKFKDADLIGIPYRITVGKKLPQGMVELVERKPKRSTDVTIDKVVDAVREKWTG
jgi:prolyl-tRNA synthetase